MASWFTALGSMGASITGTKDVYKPTENTQSAWSQLAVGLAAAAGTIGLSALAAKVGQPTLAPVVRMTPGGVPIPTIPQPGALAGNTIGAAGTVPAPGAAAQRTLLIVGGLVLAGAVVLAVMKSGRR
jgi:hypothetical protein